MSRRNGKYTAEQFVNAIPGTGGIISTIAQRVGCDWHTAEAYINKYATVKQIYNDEAERVLDIAESVLIENIKLSNQKQQVDGEIADSSDAKWLLSKKGKARGFTDEQRININIDVTALNDNELERIASGEDPLTVINSKS